MRLCGLAQAGLKQDPDSEELKEGKMRTIQAMTSVPASSIQSQHKTPYECFVA